MWRTQPCNIIFCNNTHTVFGLQNSIIKYLLDIHVHSRYRIIYIYIILMANKHHRISRLAASSSPWCKLACSFLKSPFLGLPCNGTFTPNVPSSSYRSLTAFIFQPLVPSVATHLSPTVSTTYACQCFRLGSLTYPHLSLSCTLEIIQKAYLQLGKPLHSCSFNLSIMSLHAPEQMGMMHVLARLYSKTSIQPNSSPLLRLWLLLLTSRLPVEASAAFFMLAAALPLPQNRPP